MSRRRISSAGRSSSKKQLKKKKKASRKKTTRKAAKTAKKKATRKPTAKKTTKKKASKKKTQARRKAKPSRVLPTLPIMEGPQLPNEKRKALPVHHFMGLSLAGGKLDKTCLAVVEYYPNQNKIFLSRLFENISSEPGHSGDLKIHQLISQVPSRVEAVAFDVPLRLPKCMRCRLECPGYETCEESEIVWMREHYHKRNAKRKPKRPFTPYTERCVEQHVASELEEVFHMPHALGANLAPLTARAHFITRRLNVPVVETYPQLSLWRIGRSLGVSKSHLRHHKHSVHGAESRRGVIKKLVANDIAFLYEQDIRSLVENKLAFDSFIAALTAVLDFKGQCEARPKGFPRSASWILIPKEKLNW